MAIYSFLTVSCTNDAPPSKPILVGYWSMEKALRDSRETNLLDAVFFQFEANGTMFTNLPNTSDAPTEFELNDNIIVQKTADKVQYNILSITDTTLVLAFNRRNTPFEFHLKKTAAPLPPATPADSLQ